jgi:hypothetical protein
VYFTETKKYTHTVQRCTEATFEGICLVATFYFPKPVFYKRWWLR